MLRKGLPVLLALIGLGAGVGSGLALRAVQKSEAAEDGEGLADDLAGAKGHKAADPDGVGGGPEPEYVRLNNQFVVPVVERGRVSALVVLALSLEIAPGSSEAVYLREPKLRDVLLQVMFDHANVGGFSGSFTDGSNLVVLRNNLKEAAALVLGAVVRDVLITDIARQDS